MMKFWFICILIKHPCSRTAVSYAFYEEQLIKNIQLVCVNLFENINIAKTIYFRDAEIDSLKLWSTRTLQDWSERPENVFDWDYVGIKVVGA